jgi:hypothetical protein
MKSYWIAAAAILFITWPPGSKAYVPGADQQGQPAVQADKSPSPSSSPSYDSSKLQVSAVSASAAAAPSAPAAPQAKSSFMVIELIKGLKARKLKPGDKVKAEVTQAVVSHNKVIIPAETRLIGHVTEVSVRSEGNPESRLGIVFDRIVLKHFHDINFQAVVQAVAPPMQRRSRVDEPSQMLPPSMIGGGMRQSPSAIPGRPGSTTRSAAVGPSSTASMGDPGMTMQTPFSVKESPSTNAQTGGAAVQLTTTPGGKPLSVGVPQGVIGLKGLSLSAGPTASTPGPVIVSNSGDVKLDYGTQMLLRVTSVEVPQPTEKSK